MNRILVVNDDIGFHEDVLQALKDNSHSVWWAPDGGEALALLADVPVDLIIVEYNPQVIELLESLRCKHPNVKSLLIIERGTPEAVIGALCEHVCDFLVTPFTTDELHGAVNAALSGCPGREIEVVSAQPQNGWN